MYVRASNRFDLYSDRKIACDDKDFIFILIFDLIHLCKIMRLERFE